MILLFFVLIFSQGTISLNKALQNKIASYFSSDDKIYIENVSVQGEVKGEYVVHRVSPEPPKGFVYFEVNQKGKRILGRAFVRRFSRLAIAKTEIKRNESLTSENIEFLEKDTTPYLQAGTFEKLDSLQGSVAKQNIRKGEVIKEFYVAKPYDVTQGQMVDLVSAKGALKVTLRALALESGRAGDWIVVQNTRSKKNVRAKVSAENEVRIP